MTGAGTGLNAEGLARKIAVLRQVLDHHAGVSDPLAVLAAMGGLEIATMTGAVLQAAAERRVIVVDGFITTAAVLVASRMQPHVLQRCIYAHRSGEPGHQRMLAHLQAQPLLDWQLRLGEGSGRRWPGRCCSRPAPCSMRWRASSRLASAPKASHSVLG